MSRIQLALNVDDLDTAVDFYSKLFGTEPAKTRPGYANFAIANPPLKLVLLEDPGQGDLPHPNPAAKPGPAEEPGPGRHAKHLGVEVETVDEVDATQTRLASV